MAAVGKLLVLPAVVLLCCCLEGSAKSSGGWGEWSQYSTCSKSCGMGLRSRVRDWQPGQGEDALTQPWTNTEQFDCILPACPQNGSWSGWGMFATCDAACGEGTRKRHRDCNNPPPLNGGAKCKGVKWNEEPCTELPPCPDAPVNFDMSACLPVKNFTCTSGVMCVDMRHRCDGAVDCNDGSDELKCVGQVLYSAAPASHGYRLNVVMMTLTVLGSFWFRKVHVTWH